MENPFKPKTFFKLLIFLYRVSSHLCDVTQYEKPCGSLKLTDRRIDARWAIPAKTLAAIVIYDVIPSLIRAATGAS